MIKGFCNIRACNDRAASKRKQNNNENDLPEKIARTDEECKADVEILKTLLVRPENMAEIKEKLVATMESRMKMIDTVELDLLEKFPYFFTDPTLVRNEK